MTQPVKDSHVYAIPRAELAQAWFSYSHTAWPDKDRAETLVQRVFAYGFAQGYMRSKGIDPSTTMTNWIFV